jgi:hypothetical protein
MLERCPTCRKTIGTLMESDPDNSGLIEIRSDVANEGARIALTVACACCLCSPPSPPRPCCASASGVSVDRYSLLWADSVTQSCEEDLTRLIFA